MVQSDPLLKLKAKSAPSHQQFDVCKVLMKSSLAGHNITIWNMPGTFWNSCLRAPPNLYRRCWKRCAGNCARGAQICLSLPKRPDLQRDLAQCTHTSTACGERSQGVPITPTSSQHEVPLAGAQVWGSLRAWY